MSRRPATRLQSVSTSVLRSTLATTLVWVGALKFEDYEVENIHPMVSSSPPFSAFVSKLGEEKTARLIGVAEIALGSLIAAKPLSPKASAIGSLGAAGVFVTTLSFLATTPGVWQEGQGPPKLSLVGQFLAKDSVFLGAALVTAADSLRAA